MHYIALSCSRPRPLSRVAVILLPLRPERIGTSIESVLKFKTGAQGSHVTSAGPTSSEQTVRGGGGRQGPTAVTGGWRHQLLHIHRSIYVKEEKWNIIQHKLSHAQKSQTGWCLWTLLHLNIGQAFLQVGNHFRELRSVLKWKNMLLFVCLKAEH